MLRLSLMAYAFWCPEVTPYPIGRGAINVHVPIATWGQRFGKDKGEGFTYTVSRDGLVPLHGRNGQLGTKKIGKIGR